MQSAPEIQVQSEFSQVYGDLLSQAITGELVGMLNYAALATLAPDIGGQTAAVRHAAAELRHAENFRQVAKECGLSTIVNPGALRWGQVRDAFQRYAADGNLVACLLIQEVMLESMAVALYSELASLPDKRIARVFAATAREESDHVDAGLDHLQLAATRDPAGFADLAETVHDEVMLAIAEMLAGEEGEDAHCGLCAGNCVKQSLPSVGLDRSKLRGRALRHYLESLDALGIPGDRSLAWVARLPL